jgi:hypothetical protein
VLDIEFLSAGVSAETEVGPHILYTYTHALFVPRVKARVKELHWKRHRRCRNVDYERFSSSLVSGSFFEDFCVWVALEKLAEQPKRDEIFEILVDTLHSNPPNALFVYGPDSAFSKHPKWRPALLEAPLKHVEEPVLSDATFSKILAFLDDQLPNRLRLLKNRRECERTLQAWCKENALNLLDFRTELDQIAMLCVETTTQTFDLTAFHEFTGTDKANLAQRAWDKLLAEFLAGRPNGLLQLLRALDRAMHEDWLDARAIVARLHRATLNLLSNNQLAKPARTNPDRGMKDRRSQRESEPSLRASLLWRWQIRLAQAEPRLRQGGLLAWADFLESVHG